LRLLPSRNTQKLIYDSVSTVGGSRPIVTAARSILTSDATGREIDDPQDRAGRQRGDADLAIGTVAAYGDK
jgi:hypothetical protein